MQVMEQMQSADKEMARIRAGIRTTVTRRDRLKAAMEAWYENRSSGRFPQLAELLSLDETLSRLDSRYRCLWDRQQAQQ